MSFIDLIKGICGQDVSQISEKYTPHEVKIVLNKKKQGKKEGKRQKHKYLTMC